MGKAALTTIYCILPRNSLYYWGFTERFSLGGTEISNGSPHCYERQKIDFAEQIGFKREFQINNTGVKW